MSCSSLFTETRENHWELRHRKAQESIEEYFLSGRKLVYKNSNNKINLPNLTPHCRSNTFLPYPTVLFSLAGRKSPQLLSISVHRNSYQCGCFAPTNPLIPAAERNSFAEKVKAKGEKLLLLSSSLAYFRPFEAKKRQPSFPRWKNTLLEQCDRPPAPKTSPPAPFSSHPPTHTQTYITPWFTHAQPVRK